MIAHSYNPLADKNSIFYQTMATNKKIKVQPIGVSTKKNSHFLSKKKYFSYQIGEIDNKDIQNYVKEYWDEHENKVLFDFKTGWFTKEALRNLKKLIQIKLN
jgi:predicted ATP-grasp superfamily ATP-dependent carboligase